MDELKTIWRTADDLTLELDLLARPSNIETVHQQLADEDRRLKKWLPFTYAFIVLMLLGMTVFFYAVGALGSPLAWVGWALVMFASWCVAYFAQAIKIPFGEFVYAQPTRLFLNDVKEALHRKRAFLLAGVSLQSLFLSLGISLIIYADTGGAANLGGLLGLMLGIGGGMVGMMAMAFELNYGKVRRVVNEFLASEDTLDLV